MDLYLSSIVSWNPVAGAVEYRVRLYPHDDVPDTANVIGQVDTVATQVQGDALIGAANDGASYKLAVRAKGANGVYGPWSTPLSVVARLSPGQVTGVSIS